MPAKRKKKKKQLLLWTAQCSQNLPSWRCIGVFCSCLHQSSWWSSRRVRLVLYSILIDSLNNTHAPDWGVWKSKEMARTEDWHLFLRHCCCFSNFLICLLPVIWLLYPHLYSVSFQRNYVDNEGWNISSLCCQVASCSGPWLTLCSWIFERGRE